MLLASDLILPSFQLAEPTYALAELGATFITSSTSQPGSGSNGSNGSPGSDSSNSGKNAANRMAASVFSLPIAIALVLLSLL
jgi:hypothetical protein